MKILAIDSSGMTASAAIVSEEAVLAEYNTDFKKTHSQTLLPMIDAMTRILDLDLSSLDAVAVAKGPGSFTGLRIGSATAKGIALALDRPIAEISALEAMAYALYPAQTLIVPIMDARRSQVYTGIYKFRGEELECVSVDEAMAMEELIARLNDIGEELIFTGDGIPVFAEMIKEKLKVPYKFAKAFQDRQRAAVLGILAIEYAKQGRLVSADEHVPVYLRMSQAERERAERLKDSDKRDADR